MYSIFQKLVGNDPTWLLKSMKPSIRESVSVIVISPPQQADLRSDR